MNKADLVNAIAEKVDSLNKTQAKEVLDAVVTSIEDALVAGEKVQLTGFGTWETTKRAARKGRNPQTGESIDIPEKTVAKFKVSKALNEKVNG